MADVNDWRDKTDLELTADDLGQMLDDGLPAELVHEPPVHLPGGAVVGRPVASGGAATVVRAYPYGWAVRTEAVRALTHS